MNGIININILVPGISKNVEMKLTGNQIHVLIILCKKINLEPYLKQPQFHFGGEAISGIKVPT